MENNKEETVVENIPMELPEAINLIRPDLQESAIERVPEDKRNDALVEAAFLLCEAAMKQLILPVNSKSLGSWTCPICGKVFYSKQNYCSICGQALDFNGHSKQIVESVKPQIIMPN